jgi:nucleotide-binding universal stress UspA family protein
MFETILVPVDGSKASWDATAQAIDIAKRAGSGATLHGLYVVDTAALERIYGFQTPEAGIPYETLTQAAEDLRASMEQQGGAALAEFMRRTEEAGIAAKSEQANGSVGSVICDRAGLADLVVMGRRGTGEAVTSPLMGSTFEAVVRCSQRPVLVSVGLPRPVQLVLVAYDGSDRAKDALEAVVHAEWTQGAEVTVLTVAEGSHAGTQELDAAGAFLREHGIEPTLLPLPDEHPAAAILRVAEERKADLIAMGGYGHGRFLEIFFGHTVNEVLRRTTRPVLVCR